MNRKTSVFCLFLTFTLSGLIADAEQTVQGKSMNRVTFERNLGVSADQVWPVLADFGGFLKWAASGSIDIEGEGPGMIRRINLEGQAGLIAERADVIDHDTKTLVYTLVEGNPIGMASYRARVQLHAMGDDVCSISWLGEFEAVDGADADTVVTALEGAYIGMTTALEAYVMQ